ncbi:MAG: hypothetical protein FWF50_01485 [Defluviitaleaceae bacterium]|nr:hypothetical protein [Defluviitaleaceae bacterium]
MAVSYLDKIRVVKEPTEKAYNAWAVLKAAELIALWDRKGYTQEQRNAILADERFIKALRAL